MESPLILAARIIAVAAAAVLFLLFVAESVGLGPTVYATFHWIAFRAHRLVDTWISLVLKAVA
jgi:hypothetical protein